MSEFTAGSLRELRLQAGLSQRELSKRSGISAVTICHIETGKTHPEELTWRSLLKALSPPLKEKEQTREKAAIFFGEVLNREEFFRQLKPKMSQSLGVFFNESLISMLVDNAEFFSRSKFYPGDFATGVEILGELLRAQKRLFLPDGVEDDEGDGGKTGRRRILPGGYRKKWPKKR